MFLDSILCLFLKILKTNIFTLGTESIDIDLKELSSSLFVYIMLKANYVPITMLFAYSIFRNLAVMIQVLLLCSETATALCYNIWWVYYFGIAMLVVCPPHAFKGTPCPICPVNFFKGDGQKNTETSAH